jgi:magnesium-transporting ATPase (P-type)
VLDSVALFSSISVILFLLCGIPRTKIVMKFLIAVLWLAVFCTALAFASALENYKYYPNSEFQVTDENYDSKSVQEFLEQLWNRTNWEYSLLIAWTVVYVIASLWGSVRVIMFLWRKGGFKTKSPNWVGKLGWPKNARFRKTSSVIFMVCFLALLGLATWVLWLGITMSWSRPDTAAPSSD